jgi:MFS family permease
MLTNALTVGYRNSVITTIEKQFEFSSSFSGILSGFLELGSLITTLFVSYFCAKSHIPRCIAISSLFCAVGSFLYAVPHFLTDSYTINNRVMNKTSADLMCKLSLRDQRQHLAYNHYLNHSAAAAASSSLFLDDNSNSETVKSAAIFGVGGSGDLDNKALSAVVSFLNPFDNPGCIIKPNNLGFFILLIMANVFIGSSSAPLYTLGTTYIDNHVSKESSSVYLAFIYSQLAFGPVVGYLVGAAFLQVYVDVLSYSTQELNIKPGDSNWVGNWYGGYLLFALLIFITSFPFFAFPRYIK